MKIIYKALLVVLVATPLVSFGNAGKTDWVAFESGNWSFPYGNSVSKTFHYAGGLDASALKITYTGSYCDVEVRYIDVTYEPGGFVDRVSPRHGIFELSQSQIYSLKVYNYQGTYTKVSCRETFYYRRGGSSSGFNLNDFDFLETARYVGGDTVQKVSQKSPERITHFWVEVPSYCSDLKIRKAGTITEGVLDEAELVDAKNRVYRVNGGVGTRISAISLDLKGPKDLVCDLAIYVLRK